MKVNIGQKIKKLRLKQNLTQTGLAEKLEVSPQAVSRWEMNATYPDIELIPAIANYFGVSIDDLFGNENKREARIREIIAEAEELSREDNGKDVNIERRFALLRNGLAEYPGEERLRFHLALALLNAGWVRIGEYVGYDEKGYLVHDVDTNQANEYWNEAVALFEALIAETKDARIYNESVQNLILLYTNFGQYEKGLTLAEKTPRLTHSRELLRASATDGAASSRYEGEAVLALLSAFSTHLVYALMSRKANFEGDAAVRTLTAMVHMIETLFEDGNMGVYHEKICFLLLYLSEHQWRCGMQTEAFVSLDKAAEHAKKYDALAGNDEITEYTSALFKGISMQKELWPKERYTPSLPADWPMWMKPDYQEIEKEMTADPRWAEWVRRRPFQSLCKVEN